MGIVINTGRCKFECTGVYYPPIYEWGGIINSFRFRVKKFTTKLSRGKSHKMILIACRNKLTTWQVTWA